MNNDFPVNVFPDVERNAFNKFTKKKEIERLGYNEDNVWVNDGSSIQFFDKEDQRRKNKH